MKWAAVILIAPLLGAATWIGTFSVTSDKENVVASRLEGAWVADAPMYERLKGAAPSAKLPTLTFRSAREVADQIPDQYSEFLGSKTIYMAGYVKWGDKEMPFVLIDLHGNPYLVKFSEEFAKKEACNLMLAPAKESKDDLLLVGGDLNTESFKAYRHADASVPAQTAAGAAESEPKPAPLVKATPPKAKAPSVAPDPLAIGNRWSGKWNGSSNAKDETNCSVSVKARDQSARTATLDVVGSKGRVVHVDIKSANDGSSFSVKGARPGKNCDNLKDDCTGNGKVNGTKLTMDFFCHWLDSGKSWDWTIDATQY